jgi:hypothetical protein
MTSLLVPLSYPLILADEQRAINRMALAVAMVLHTMEKEHSRKWLKTTLQRYLREGALTISEKAVEAADAGDEIADGALRDVGAELQTALVQGRDLAPGHLQVIAYFQRAGRRAPHKRPRGQRWYDDWFRNLAICILVQLACAEYGVDPTRNRESRRAKQYPSGISLVVGALARNKIHIEEESVQRHIWLGLPGELARQIVAERPIETWLGTV